MKTAKRPKIPVEINGTKVVVLSESETEFNGEKWITLLPQDEHDERIWEFSLTTGHILQTSPR